MVADFIGFVIFEWHSQKSCNNGILVLLGVCEKLYYVTCINAENLDGNPD